MTLSNLETLAPNEADRPGQRQCVAAFSGSDRDTPNPGNTAVMFGRVGWQVGRDRCDEWAGQLRAVGDDPLAIDGVSSIVEHCHGQL